MSIARVGILGRGEVAQPARTHFGRLVAASFFGVGVIGHEGGQAFAPVAAVPPGGEVPGVEQLEHELAHVFLAPVRVRSLWTVLMGVSRGLVQRGGAGLGQRVQRVLW